jgi:hypothetical protein
VSFEIPRKIERLVRMTLEGAQAKVIVDGKISAPFVIGKGVRQGDGLSGLFKLALHKALKKSGTKQHDFEQIKTNLWTCL